MKTRQELLDDVLRLVCEAADAALARVWLMGPGDSCATCAMRPECPDQSRCLHLAASAGVTTRTDGQYRRFPLGARQVGQVAITRTPFVERDRVAEVGVADRAWLAAHRIASFAAFPIGNAERCLGVLAVFSRHRLGDHELRLLAASAQHAAIAVSIMRAVEERESRRAGAPPPEAGADATGDPGAQEPAGPSAQAGPHAAGVARADAAPPALRTLAEIERDAIAEVLRHTGGRVSGPRGAAKILGLKPTTLESRMKKLGVRKPAR
jgi:GAF domain-containing protein